MQFYQFFYALIVLNPGYLEAQIPALVISNHPHSSIKESDAILKNEQ